MTNPMSMETGAVKPYRRGIAILFRLTSGWAQAGALLFCVLVLMSIVSIVGRKLFSSPIVGDIEILMMGAAVASATFLPLCEMDDNHVRVDALTSWMSPRGQAVLDVMAHGLLMLAALLLTWRTALYVIETHENTEVSTLLMVPLWIPVMLLLPSFALLILAALYRMAVSVEIVFGRQA